ncbi:MAG: M20/M25/M40 family metallo-hydrolase [Acidimicrobiales bacterium]
MPDTLSGADNLSGEVAELLGQMIRNACVNDGTPSSGTEHRSAAVLEQVLAVAGVELQSFEPLPGRSSLVARIPGSDPSAPTLALVGHTDVVPASPEGWSHDPFGGERDEGYVWGRGAVDMLNLTASMAVALRRLAASGFRPRGTLSFLAVADEEAGGHHGAEWLLDNVEQAAAGFVITESGGIPVQLPDGVALGAMVAEKGLAWCRLSVRGTPGHGSRPYRSDNALVKAAQVVERLAGFAPPAAVVPAWAAFVEGLGLPEGLADPRQVDQAVEGLDGRLARLAHACTHTTFSPNVAHGGQKTNIIPDRVDLEVDIRTLPGQGTGDVRALIAEALGPLAADVDLEMLQDQQASESPTASPLWEAMGEAAAALRPGARLLPSMMAGATDARWWRARGATAYGFGLFSDSISPDDYDAMFHGRNERVDLESLRLSAELWEGIARRFLA